MAFSLLSRRSNKYIVIEINPQNLYESNHCRQYQLSMYRYSLESVEMFKIIGDLNCTVPTQYIADWMQSNIEQEYEEQASANIRTVKDMLK